MDGKTAPAPRPTATASSTCSTATNGKFISALPFVTKITWAKGIDLKTGRPIYIDREPSGRSDQVAADGKKGSSIFAAPSFLGGKNWMPMAYSQDTGLFYVPVNEWGMDIWNEPIAYKKGAAYLGAGFTIKPLYDDSHRRAARDRPEDRQDRLGSTRTRRRCGAAC